MLLGEGRRDEALSFHDGALRLLVSSERFAPGADDLPDATVSAAGPTPEEDFDRADVDEEDRAAIELVSVFARRAAPYLARIILDVHRNRDIVGDQNAYFAELAAGVAGDLGARDVIEELIDAARRGMEPHLAD